MKKTMRQFGTPCKYEGAEKKNQAHPKNLEKADDAARVLKEESLNRTKKA